MICRKCKKEAPDGAFCIFCGARQDKSRSAPRKRGNGQGCAYKRGNTWTGQTPGYSFYTEENGKKILHRVRQRKGGFATKKEALEWAQEQIDGQSQFDHINNIIIIDADTGEVLAECTPDVDPYENWDDWNYNEDMGYDPYLGCYTDDC